MIESCKSKNAKFFIIGAAKSGTTSLFYKVKDHPSIFCPHIKELNYFCQSKGGLSPGCGPGDNKATKWVSDVSEYRSYFEKKREHQIAGEASVSYLYSPVSADRIRGYRPDAKIIAVLRDPVDRAWSNYCHMVRDGRETLDFMEALDAEERRIEEGWEFSWHYSKLGLYGKQLKRYFDCFSKSNIKTFLFQDLKSDIDSVVKEIFSFLGVDSSYKTAVGSRHNRSGKVKSEIIARFVNRPNIITRIARKIVPLEVGHRVMEILRRLNMDEKPSIPDEARRYLSDFYAEDVKHTEHLTDLDLSHWKSYS